MADEEEKQKPELELCKRLSTDILLKNIENINEEAIENKNISNKKIIAKEEEQKNEIKQCNLSVFDDGISETDIFKVTVQKSRFRVLFDMINEAGIIHNGKKILNVNKAFEKMSCYKKEEVIGKPLSKIIKRNKLIKKDGTISEIILEQDNIDENYIILLSDIKSLKEMEKCYALFNILSDYTHDAVMQIDSKGKIIYANNAARKMFELPIMELENKTLKELFKRSNKLKQMIKKVSAGDIVNSEIEYIRNKSFFPANILLHNISGGDEILCILKDISKEKSLESQIEKAKEEYEQLVNYVNDIIFSIDYQGNITYVNHQFEKQLGYKNGEIKSIISIIHPDDLQRVITFLSEYKKGFKDLEFRVQNSKKRWIYFSINAVPIKEGNKIIGFRGTMRNINEKKKVEDKTEQKRKELERQNKELEEREKIKSLFVSNVSHDLKTPLTSIQGYSELLSNGVLGSLNKEQEEAASIIHSESLRLGKLINDILDVSKIEAGSLILNKKPFFLSTLEEKCSCRPLADKKGLTLIWNTPDNIGEVYADPDRIAQVFTNLISNAIKYTERGSVTINAFSKDKRFIQVDVIDTCIGIKRSEWDKIFDRFYQVEKKGRKEGTGLGLSIARDIITLHGGKIYVADSSTKGTKFSFTIPKYNGENIKLENIIEDSLQNTEDITKQEVAHSVIEVLNKKDGENK